MSKIKEQMLRDQENLMEYYVGFYEWLDSLNNDLIESDIDRLEEEHKSSPTKWFSSNTSLSKYLANNKGYNPQRGA